MNEILLYELTEGPLAAELAPLITMGDDAGIVTALNRKDIPSAGRITSHDIRQYLMLHDLLLAIEHSNTPTCIATKRALEVFPVFALDISYIYAKFVQVLDGLVAETQIPDFTAQHKTELLGLAATTVSRAEQLGIYVTNKDVINVIWNADGTRRLI